MTYLNLAASQEGRREDMGKSDFVGILASGTVRGWLMGVHQEFIPKDTINYFAFYELGGRIKEGPSIPLIEKSTTGVK